MLAWLEAGEAPGPEGPIALAAPQAAAVAGTRLYTPADVAALPEGPAGRPGRVRVIDATTQQAALELAGADPVLLNFASARNPGGGFLKGASAQEEDLCRCSGLYPTLLTQPAYYEANRACRSLLYTDHAIHSPRVPFFRAGSRAPLEPRAFLASVITAPAPNSRPHLRQHPGDEAAIEATFRRRWRLVLAIARAEGHRTLIAGAWGCGAFGGDPAVAAATADAALDLAADLDEVVFAIPSKGPSRKNLEAFRRRFS